MICLVLVYSCQNISYDGIFFFFLFSSLVLSFPPPISFNLFSLLLFFLSPFSPSPHLFSSPLFFFIFQFQLGVLLHDLRAFEQLYPAIPSRFPRPLLALPLLLVLQSCGVSSLSSLGAVLVPHLTHGKYVRMSV